MKDKNRFMTSQGLDNQDPQVIVAKANLTLTAMKSTLDDIPESIQFMSAKTLAKGNIPFNMDSSESAEWIRKGGVCMEFMQGFSAMSKIKDCEHSCVVKNVPISLHLSTESPLEIESTNGLTPKSIILGHWIKPIEHCYEGQCTAFMIITFHTAEDTNKAIHNNFYIFSKCCTTCKLLPEP
jgi:hypothetical protein